MKNFMLLILGTLLILLIIPGSAYITSSPNYQINSSAIVIGRNISTNQYSMSGTLGGWANNMSTKNYHLRNGIVGRTGGVANITLTFGPNISVFRILGCGNYKTNFTAEPEGQTSSIGIDRICNNGTTNVDLQVRRAGNLSSGWTMYASNTSITTNLINVSTEFTNIYGGLNKNTCTYIWYKFGCTNITRNLGTYEEYNATVK